jgi:hypothetical protein
VEPFAVVLEPAAEMRSQRAKRIMVGQIKAEHAERDQRANLELDAEAFRARPFIAMAAEALGQGAMASSTRGGISALRRVTLDASPRSFRARVPGTQLARRQCETSRERAHRGRH